jgi:hypothetical protein
VVVRRESAAGCIGRRVRTGIPGPDGAAAATEVGREKQARAVDRGEGDKGHARQRAPPGGPARAPRPRRPARTRLPQAASASHAASLACPSDSLPCLVLRVSLTYSFTDGQARVVLTTLLEAESPVRQELLEGRPGSPPWSCPPGHGSAGSAFGTYSLRLALGVEGENPSQAATDVAATVEVVR